MNIVRISVEEKNKILNIEEDHFNDLKAKEIKPAKVTQTLSAFANAEGGEVYIGVDENKATGKKTWRGFSNQEEANGFIQAFENLFPLSGEFSYTFLQVDGEKSGLVLKVEVQKTREIKKASNGKVYVRRGAQKIPVETEEGLSRLRRNKGLSTYETETVNGSVKHILESEVIARFISEVVPHYYTIQVA